MPVKWTAPEVCVQLHYVYRACALLYERSLTQVVTPYNAATLWACRHLTSFKTN